MTERSELPTTAAVGIWAASLIGSAAIGLAVLGAVDGGLFGCGPDAPLANGGDGGVGGWLIVGAGAFVPVLVMVAIAPPGRRSRLIGLAVATAVAVVVAFATWIGPCL